MFKYWKVHLEKWVQCFLRNGIPNKLYLVEWIYVHSPEISRIRLIKVPFGLWPIACGVVYIFFVLRERWGQGVWHWLSVFGNSVAWFGLGFSQLTLLFRVWLSFGLKLNGLLVSPCWKYFLALTLFFLSFE